MDWGYWGCIAIALQFPYSCISAGVAGCTVVRCAWIGVIPLAGGCVQALVGSCLARCIVVAVGLPCSCIADGRMHAGCTGGEETLDCLGSPLM